MSTSSFRLMPDDDRPAPSTNSSPNPSSTEAAAVPARSRRRAKARTSRGTTAPMDLARQYSRRRRTAAEAWDCEAPAAYGDFEVAARQNSRTETRIRARRIVKATRARQEWRRNHSTCVQIILLLTLLVVFMWTFAMFVIHTLTVGQMFLAKTNIQDDSVYHFFFQNKTALLVVELALLPLVVVILYELWKQCGQCAGRGVLGRSVAALLRAACSSCFFSCARYQRGDDGGDGGGGGGSSSSSSSSESSSENSSENRSSIESIDRVGRLSRLKSGGAGAGAGGTGDGAVTQQLVTPPPAGGGGGGRGSAWASSEVHTGSQSRLSLVAQRSIFCRGCCDEGGSCEGGWGGCVARLGVAIEDGFLLRFFPTTFAYVKAVQQVVDIFWVYRILSMKCTDLVLQILAIQRFARNGMSAWGIIVLQSVMLCNISFTIILSLPGRGSAARYWRRFGAESLDMLCDVMYISLPVVYLIEEYVNEGIELAAWPLFYISIAQKDTWGRDGWVMELVTLLSPVVFILMRVQDIRTHILQDPDTKFQLNTRRSSTGTSGT